MQSRVATLAFALSLTAPSSFAGDDLGRYSLAPVGDGVLRLDSATGAISICKKKLADWACESVGDDALALKQEIDRLTRETKELGERLAKAEAELAARAEAEPPRPYTTVPGRAEFTDFVNTMIRRLQDMVRELKRQQQAEKAL